MRLINKRLAPNRNRVRIREGTFFLGGGGEGWGILVFFSQKSVGPPLHFNKKTSDPPPPHL